MNTIFYYDFISILWWLSLWTNINKKNIFSTLFMVIILSASHKLGLYFAFEFIFAGFELLYAFLAFPKSFPFRVPILYIRADYWYRSIFEQHLRREVIFDNVFNLLALYTKLYIWYRIISTKTNDRCIKFLQKFLLVSIEM